MKKKRKQILKKDLENQNEKNISHFNKQTLLGVIGGSGFLLIIKGVGGLIESVFERPSAQWRTGITFGNLFLYLIIILVTMITVNTLTSMTHQKKRIYQIIGVTTVTIFVAFVLTLTVPFFKITLFGIHPMILVLAGAVLLPVSGNLSFRKNDEI